MKHSGDCATTHNRQPKKNVMRARGLVALSKCGHKSQLSACVYLVLDVERFYYRRLNISFRDRRKTATIEISRGLSSQINCGRIDEKITRWSCVTSTDTAYHIDLASRTIHNSQWHLPLPVLFRQPLWLFRLFGPFARVCDKVPLNLHYFVIRSLSVHPRHSKTRISFNIFAIVRVCCAHPIVSSHSSEVEFNLHNL